MASPVAKTIKFVWMFFKMGSIIKNNIKVPI